VRRDCIRLPTALTEGFSLLDGAVMMLSTESYLPSVGSSQLTGARRGCSRLKQTRSHHRRYARGSPERAVDLLLRRLAGIPPATATRCRRNTVLAVSTPYAIAVTGRSPDFLTTA
jgi:hypothetical protein